MTTFTCTALFNLTSSFSSFSSGDRLEVSKLGRVEVKAADVYDAAEEFFTMLNRDDRPNGSYERSLSVGDVIVVEDETGTHTVLACDPHSWREV